MICAYFFYIVFFNRKDSSYLSSEYFLFNYSELITFILNWLQWMLWIGSLSRCLCHSETYFSGVSTFSKGFVFFNHKDSSYLSSEYFLFNYSELIIFILNWLQWMLWIGSLSCLCHSETYFSGVSTFSKG